MTPPESFAIRPRSTRPNGAGWRARVVPNKYPFLSPSSDGGEGGIHEVLIETPDHSIEYSNMKSASIALIFKALKARFVAFRADERIASALFFKNHRAEAGATIAHPHSQLVGAPFVFPTLERELIGARAYRRAEGRCHICVALESAVTGASGRLIEATENFVACSPYAPRFSYEIWIAPRAINHAPFEAMPDSRIDEFAGLLKRSLGRIDLLLDFPPFNMILHSAPLKGGDFEEYHWRFEIFPVLGRLAGFELGSGMTVNICAPEEAAAALRSIQVEEK